MAGLILIPLAAAGPITTGPIATGTVDVRIEGLRSTKGLIRACLTRDPTRFLKCETDPAARSASVPATAPVLHFAGVAPGDYALVILHDENANARADMFMGIPREGVGFSRNPVLRMGPPKFAAVRFPVGATAVPQVIRLKYFL